MYTFLTANDIRTVNAMVEIKEWGKLTKFVFEILKFGLPSLPNIEVLPPLAQEYPIPLSINLMLIINHEKMCMSF